MIQDKEQHVKSFGVRFAHQVGKIPKFADARFDDVAVIIKSYFEKFEISEPDSPVDSHVFEAGEPLVL